MRLEAISFALGVVLAALVISHTQLPPPAPASPVVGGSGGGVMAVIR